MNDKMKPAVIGGVILGVLSAIPFVNWVNICCCAWAIVGGIIAANMYVKNSAVPATPADGAMVGAIAGVVGAVVNFIIGVPLQLITGNAMQRLLQNIAAQQDPAQAAQMREMMAAQGSGIGGAILGGLIGGVLLIVFATVGGLIGVSIFEKRKGGAGAPPPPPPAGGFGGPGGGYGGPGPGGGAGYGQGM